MVKTQAQMEFSPSKHLTFKTPDIVTMEHMGYPEDYGISLVAYSRPFQLFSKDAVEEMRREIFAVRKNHEEHIFSSNIASSQLRGYAAKFAPFTYDAWSHPETIATISQVARIELVPWGNYEIAHINFSARRDGKIQLHRVEPSSDTKRAHGEITSVEDRYHEESGSIVDWHKDSYPFVCILMLSDCSSTVGGEIAVQKANGEVDYIRGLALGCAVVLQGRYITHRALRMFGNTERITSVTSFRAKSPFVRDDSVLETVRPVSELSELYFDFAKYRMEVLVDRLKAKLKSLRDENCAGKRTMVAALKNFLAEQEVFIAHTNREILPYNEVQMGRVSDSVLPDTLLSTSC